MRLVPETISAGISLRFDVSLSAYPVDTWTAALHVRGANVIDLTATVVDGVFRFEIPAATSAAYVAGPHAYSLRLSNGATVAEAEAGSLSIAANLASAAAGFDSRTHAQKTLDAIEAVIAQRATMDQMRYRINNRELERTPIADLLKLRATYRAEVAREQRAARGGPLFRQLKVRG